jgi:formylglycine-generating enzyme required for sulfatase activity
MLLLAVALASASTIATVECPGDMVRVPAGFFWMGSDARERALANGLSTEATRQARWFDRELPRQRAFVPTFCIDRTLVTQAAYASFVSATGHRQPGITKQDYEHQGFLVHDYDREVTRYLWRGGKPPGERDDHPVVLVSAGDAEAYCQWRARRLPDEREWERAVRGSGGQIFPWDNNWDPSRANSAQAKTLGTTPVMRYPGGASPYGVLDAVGNVFQWTASTLEGGRRVLKGCAWDDDPGLCRPAFRHGRPADSRHILIGFRCAGDPAPTTRQRARRAGSLPTRARGKRSGGTRESSRLPQ